MSASNSTTDSPRRTNPFAELPVNPFDDSIVIEPRKIEPAVEGLNDGPLLELMSRFSQFEAGPIPRDPPPAQRASLVASPDRGFGKSHLLGRLFRALRGRASLIYLRPFEDPTQPWFSILLQTVQELGRPDRFDGSTQTPFSQIEVLSYGVLTHLAADYLENTQGNSYRGMVQHLRRNPLEAVHFVTSDPSWKDWIRGLYTEYTPRLVDRFERRGIDLHGREEAWIKILFACSLGSEDRDRRRAALRWLRAESLEEEEAELLKLRPSENNVRYDANPHQVNQHCRERLLGLCKLAAFYRPFVFCFDQTESFETDTRLIVNFGTVIESLFAEFPHQLTVLTANEFSWTNALSPNFLPACHNRIQSPLLLEGINRQQGRELLKNRLDAWEVAPETIRAFIEQNWFDSVFQKRDRIPVRDLLLAAATRWQAAGHTSVTPKSPDLTALFQTCLNDIRANPQLQQFNRDALLWFVRTLAHQAEGMAASDCPATPHFPVRWLTPDGHLVHFGFEHGSHHHRWRSIANDVVSFTRSLVKPCKIVMFRTPDLEEIPKPSWQSIKEDLEEGFAHGLEILQLKPEEYWEIQAARELYADSQQRNIEWQPTEVREWLRQRLSHWWNRLAARNNNLARPVERNLPARIELLVRNERYINVSQVSEKLGGAYTTEVICSAVKEHPYIRAIATPTSIVLQWMQ